MKSASLLTKPVVVILAVILYICSIIAIIYWGNCLVEHWTYKKASPKLYEFQVALNKQGYSTFIYTNGCVQWQVLKDPIEIKWLYELYKEHNKSDKSLNQLLTQHNVAEYVFDPITGKSVLQLKQNEVDGNLLISSLMELPNLSSKKNEQIIQDLGDYLILIILYSLIYLVISLSSIDIAFTNTNSKYSDSKRNSKYSDSKYAHAY